MWSMGLASVRVWVDDKPQRERGCAVSDSVSAEIARLTEKRIYARFVQRVNFLAVFGGVVCALVATVPVCAQEAKTAGPQTRNAAAVSPSDSSTTRPSHEVTFTAFVQEIGLDDLAAPRRQSRQKQTRVDWKKLNQTSIGLTDDEWASAYSILLDGSEKVGAWSDEMQERAGLEGWAIHEAIAQRGYGTNGAVRCAQRWGEFHC